MKFTIAFIFTIVFALSTFAQTAAQPLATANGRSFTAQDLTPKVAEAWIKLPETLATARKSMLEQEIERILLEVEANSQKISVEKLIEKEVTKKVPAPTEAEIKNVYDVNKAQLGDTKLSEVRQQIITFLRDEPEKQAYTGLILSLKKRYKIVPGKDVNSKTLVGGDVLVTVGERELTFAEFIKNNGLALYEYEANVFDVMKDSLEQVVDSALYAAEAQSLTILTSEYIAREITDKLKTYTDEEKEKIEFALRDKLYPKYRVRFFINEPEPFIQDISADDDPVLGKASAPVTVVMFTDYQCPTCASVYPVLKKVVSGYGDQVRLVIRDFPLEQIHENAFQAAVASNAAKVQGKFFEFKEILYKNQESLDTESLKKYAGEIGLDVKKFESDLSNPEFAAEVRHDLADGKKYGVSGTPSIFVNGYKIRGLAGVRFKKAIDRALKK
jgi:predicted DsbA family dithiol-disulfide isomerase